MIKYLVINKEDYLLKLRPEIIEKVNKYFKPGDIIKIDLTLRENKTRSTDENSLYFIFLRYLEYNTPEYFLKAVGAVFNLQNICLDSKWWHNQFKKDYGISSTDFNSMLEIDFNKYFNWCIDYASQNIFKCRYKVEYEEEKPLILAVKKWYDDTQPHRKNMEAI